MKLSEEKKMLIMWILNAICMVSCMLSVYISADIGGTIVWAMFFGFDLAMIFLHAVRIHYSK